MRYLESSALVVVIVLVAVVPVCWVVVSPFVGDTPATGEFVEDSQVIETANAFFEREWKGSEVTSAEPADELEVFRRLTLVLWGRVPALEEVRAFEADAGAHRLERWTTHLLADRRFSDYFGQRLTRAMIGNKEQKYPGFQPWRFEKWLGDRLHEGTPYDEIVRTVLADDGVIPGNPATNFVTAEIEQGEDYQLRLAGRTVRSFLGQRIDCAQCHDHPFEDWKQSDFEGVAGHFGQVRVGKLGLLDDDRRSFKLGGTDDDKGREIRPGVPFGAEWVPERGSFRVKLAAWVTHPDNRRFRRAIVNRVWGLVLGRPFIAPVDELPDPYPVGNPDETEILDILGDDLMDHGFDLRRLVSIIARLKPFRASSTHADFENEDQFDLLKETWAVFPLTRLRNEQMYASLQQVREVQAAEKNDSGLSRIRDRAEVQRFDLESDGASEDELEPRVETTPEILLRMNGRYSKDAIRLSPWTASGRVYVTAGTPERMLEAAFLICLTRRPTTEESEHFLPLLRKRGKEQERQLEDLFWALLNSPEFALLH